MKRINCLVLRQRVVLVIAIGAALLVLGGWITDQGRPGGGWFGYAPNASIVVSTRGSMSPGAAAGVRIALIVAWAAVSLWLLRSAGPDGSPEPPAHTKTPRQE